MFKDLSLDNLQWLICHRTEPNQTEPNTIQHYRRGLENIYSVPSQRITLGITLKAAVLEILGEWSTPSVSFISGSF